MEDLQRVKAPRRVFRWTRPSLFSVNTGSGIPTARCAYPNISLDGVKSTPYLAHDLTFSVRALTMTLIASPIPPDRRYRPVQEADIHAPVHTLSLAKTHAPIRKCTEPRGRQRRALSPPPRLWAGSLDGT